MSKALTILIALAAVFFTGAATTEQNDKPPANRRNFIACPIVRDTKTMPCWLAEYDGELYYLGQQGSSSLEFYPPQLNHEVLVEGTISNEARICGGIPLKPVRISVMQELNRACNTLLPAEDGLEAPPAPARRPVEQLRQQGAETNTREFIVPFDFDSDYLTLHTTRIVGEAARVAKTLKVGKIEVTGYRATTLLSNGQKLIEKASIAKLRAQKIGEILTGLRLPAADVRVNSEPEPCDGVNDSDKRRVTIKLTP